MRLHETWSQLGTVGGEMCSTTYQPTQSGVALHPYTDRCGRQCRIHQCAGGVYAGAGRRDNAPVVTRRRSARSSARARIPIVRVPRIRILAIYHSIRIRTIDTQAYSTVSTRLHVYMRVRARGHRYQERCRRTPQRGVGPQGGLLRSPPCQLGSVPV
jgi:hypothetical protein